jgi:type I restriction enzyme S subunit
VTSGKRLPKGRRLSTTQTDHPYIRVTDMFMGGVDSAGIQFVPDDVFPEIAQFTVAAGDIFISCAGTLGLVGIVPESLDGANLTENANRIWSIQCDRRLLLSVLLSDRIQSVIQNIQTVGAQPKLALGRIRSFEIACPDDHNEQQAIAIALSDADGVVAGLERVIAKKRLIKQGAMQDLLTARRRLPGFSGEWEVKKLGSLGVCLRGVSYDGSADLFEAETTESIMLLRANNVQIGEVVYSDVQHVRKERVKPVQHLKRGDVLVCMANGSRALVGKAGVFWEEDGAAYTFGAFMGCFRPAAGAAADGFVPFLFQSDEYRNQLNVILSGSAINNLAPGQILGFSFTMPVDHSEQNAIAAVLSDMDMEIQTLRFRLAKARAVKEGMMQNLLTGRVRLV